MVVRLAAMGVATYDKLAAVEETVAVHQVVVLARLHCMVRTQPVVIVVAVAPTTALPTP